MSADWDINKVRQLAGLPLMESFDGDDDDEDPDVRVANTDKKQREFEKKNKVDATLAASEKAQTEKAAAKAAAAKAASAKPAAKPAEKPVEKESDAGDSDEKAPANETPAAAAKRRGKAPNADSKQQKAIAWCKANPGAKRAAFLKAAEGWGMGVHYASSRFSAYRKLAGLSAAPAGDVKECWVIGHPQFEGYTLASDFNGKGYRWIGETDEVDSLVMMSQQEVDDMVRYMAEWKNMDVVPHHVILED